MHRHASSHREDNSLLLDGSLSFQCALIGMKLYQAFSEHIVLNTMNTVYLKTDPSECLWPDCRKPDAMVSQAYVCPGFPFPKAPPSLLHLEKSDFGRMK